MPFSFPSKKENKQHDENISQYNTYILIWSDYLYLFTLFTYANPFSSLSKIKMKKKTTTLKTPSHMFILWKRQGRSDEQPLMVVRMWWYSTPTTRTHVSNVYFCDSSVEHENWMWLIFLLLKTQRITTLFSIELWGWKWRMEIAKLDVILINTLLLVLFVLYRLCTTMT